MHLCLDPARLYQVIIRPVYRGPTANNILPKLTNMCYMTIIVVSSWYHNLKLSKNHHTQPHWHVIFGRYGFTSLLFGVVQAGNMFQQKIDKIFKDLPNVFGIADDILVEGYDANSRYHDKTLK